MSFPKAFGAGSSSGLAEAAWRKGEVTPGSRMLLTGHGSGGEQASAGRLGQVLGKGVGTGRSSTSQLGNAPRDLFSLSAPPSHNPQARAGLLVKSSEQCFCTRHSGGTRPSISDSAVWVCGGMGRLERGVGSHIGVGVCAIRNSRSTPTPGISI